MTRGQLEPEPDEGAQRASGSGRPCGLQPVARLYGERLTALFSEVVESAASSGFECDEGRLPRVPERLAAALSYVEPPFRRVFRWLLESREVTNFTYDVTDTNKDYLASLISVVTGAPVAQVRSFVDEPGDDAALRRHVARCTLSSPQRDTADPECRFGRRLGWYAFARVLKPRVVVETGVDKGLGSVLLASALARNAREGNPGRYYGTDIDPAAGYLLQGSYRQHGAILYGDSIESLRQLDAEIDLFINDSDHAPEYEALEYETVAPKLSRRAIVLGDNCHCTDALYRFSLRTGRRFLFFAERPRDHWYPGAGIGVSFPQEPGDLPRP